MVLIHLPVVRVSIFKPIPFESQLTTPRREEVLGWREPHHLVSVQTRGYWGIESELSSKLLER